MWVRSRGLGHAGLVTRVGLRMLGHAGWITHIGLGGRAGLHGLGRVGWVTRAESPNLVARVGSRWLVPAGLVTRACSRRLGHAGGVV
jgi:hypothetical protein